MNYLVTNTGRKFDYNNISKDNIHIDDILLSLPRLNRFVGHSNRAYSVAEHSVLCALMAKKLGYSVRKQFLALIHDFTEAYANDCPAPLKSMLPDFGQIEHKIELAICDYFEIEPPTQEEYLEVKRIDTTMLLLEMRDLTLHEYEEFVNDTIYKEMLGDEDFNLKLLSVSEEEAREALKYVFEKLKSQMDSEE